jgi:hypothetical protein
MARSGLVGGRGSRVELGCRATRRAALCRHYQIGTSCVNLQKSERDNYKGGKGEKKKEKKKKQQTELKRAQKNYQ